MDCRECRSLFDELLTEGVSPAKRREASAHLESCDECHELFAATRRNETHLTDEEGAKLTSAILVRTSGTACERAHAMIGDEIHGDLPDADAELLRSHLQHCPGCAELAHAMTWTQPLLREMALIEPDADFARGVLDATSGARRPVTTPSRLERVREWGQTLWARPRFSLEAAYIGTMALVLLFGTPLSPARTAPERALEAARTGSNTMTATLAPNLADLQDAAALGGGIWKQSVAHVVQSVQELGADVDVRGRRAAPAMADLGKDTKRVITAAGSLELEDASRHLSAIGNDLAVIWHGLFGKAVPAAARQETNGTDA